jgi:zinc protease
MTHPAIARTWPGAGLFGRGRPGTRGNAAALIVSPSDIARNAEEAPRARPCPPRLDPCNEQGYTGVQVHEGPPSVDVVGSRRRPTRKERWNNRSWREDSMRSGQRLAFLAVALILLAASALQASETFKEVLPNGMTVIIRENHSSPVVNLRFYVKSGSIHEGKYLGAGITHYLEHLMSDGTTNRTLEESEREIEEIGGGYNAYTTKDHACYFLETSTEHFDEALDILSDQAMNVTLPESEVEAQRGVITREISMGYDEPNRRRYNLFGEVMFREHPAKYPAIGHLENFLQTTRDDLVDYHSRMYVPNNMVFVAVGDLDTEEAFAKIAEAFKDFERRPLDMPALPSESPQLGRRVFRESRDLDMAYVLMGWHTVQLSHPDLYPLDVLSHVLSEGNSSRLYKRLVDELGLAYSVESWSLTPSYDGGVFAVQMTLDPAKTDAAIAAVTQEIYKLRTEKLSRQEIEKAKKIKTAEFHFDRQDLEDLAESLGRSEVTSGNPDFDELYTAHIQDVTDEEIRDVVNKYFYDDNLGIVVLEPRTEEAEEIAEEEDVSPEVGEIERHVLDNGLTVLIKENHTNPVVYLGSYSQAGARFEEQNGLANFVANMMPRGTRKRSGDRIALEIDAMGAEYGCGANHTRIQSGMTVLAEDLGRGLDLFADILTNPKFDAKEMEKERPLIEAAIMARADDWTFDAMDRMLRELFPAHPYGRPPVGTPESIAEITPGDLARYHSELVTPDNTVVTLFGDVGSGEALAMIQKAFGRWKASAAPRSGIAVEPERVAGETFTSYHDRAQTVIFTGYLGMPYASEDRHAMDVLDAITSGIGYPGGWLHTDLRGNGLVYVVHAYNFTGYDAGYFGIYAATVDEALDQALATIEGYMAQICETPVTDEELERAKQLCIIMDKTTQQTNAAQSQNAAIPELYRLGYDYNDDYAEAIAAVTKDDVLRVAQKYLSDAVTVIRRPHPAEEETEAHSSTE